MIEITEDYCGFETAKLLKEKGMNESCFKHYVQKNNNDGTSEAVTVCTLQMAMKWMREEHKLFIDITAAMEDYIEDGAVKYKDPYYTWEVFSLEIGETLCFGEAQNVKKSYEDACEAAIKYCLENLI